MLKYDCREIVAREINNAAMGQKCGQNFGNQSVTACELIKNLLQLSLREALCKGWTDPINALSQSLNIFNCVKVNDNGLAAFKLFSFVSEILRLDSGSSNKHAFSDDGVDAFDSAHHWCESVSNLSDAR